MKKINDTLKKYSNTKLQSLYDVLDISTNSKEELISKITTQTGLNLLLFQLDKISLTVLLKIYSSSSEITLGEISSSTGIDIEETENQTNILASLLLIHTIKNRQLLSKKMDKIYPILEISNVINLCTEEDLKLKLGETSASLRKNNNSNKIDTINNNSKIILTMLIKSGGILSIEKAKSFFNTIEQFDDLINELIELQYIKIYHTINNFTTYLTLAPENVSSICKTYLNEEIIEENYIYNSYFALINIIRTFDVISNTGLFLTRQMRFRKIDIAKIIESQLVIYDFNKKEIDSKILSKYSLFFLSQLKCLKIYKDTTSASMKEILHELEHPDKLTLKILESLNYKSTDYNFFPSPLDVVDYDLITTSIKIVKELSKTNKEYLITTLLINQISESDFEIEKIIKTQIDKFLKSINNTIDFLIILGIVEIKNGLILLSEIGLKIYDLIFKTPLDKVEKEEKKYLYINPDFSIIIPTIELPSEALYHLLTHTEIKKTDVIIQSEINKKSITDAQKRGMTTDFFLKTLVKFSNNEIPQNLNFLIDEWQNQTIKIEISHAILLKSTHKEFIEELLRNNDLQDFIEQISPNHLLIDKDYIDEIVRIAKKKEVIISLFSDV